MKVLEIECSAIPASCAIFEDSKIIASSFTNVKLTHSETLMPMIKSTLENAKLTVGDVDAFAISSGPGSFTGIRIGISAVKGLAIKDKKPCCAVSTLAAMAHRLKHVNGIICGVMDARCNQVYNALFKCENGSLTRLTEDRALMIDELSAELNGFENCPVYVVGDGADMFCGKTTTTANVIKAEETLKYQHAEGVALAALDLIKENNTVSPEALLPFYLRLPQAERELKEKKGEK